MSFIDRELAEQGIRKVTAPAERGRLLAMAAQMLEWLPTPGILPFPYLSQAWARRRGWSLGLKPWGQVPSTDEEAWCRAAGLVSPANELIGVLPEPDMAQAQVFRVPLRPWPLNRFLSPHSLSAALLFPEDVSFVLYKDDGETLVAAGPAAFVAAVFPKGPAAAEAAFRADAEAYPDEVMRRLLLEMLDRYGSSAR